MPRYSFEKIGFQPKIQKRIQNLIKADAQTDGQNRFRNVLSKTFQMIYDTPIKAEN